MIPWIITGDIICGILAVIYIWFDSQPKKITLYDLLLTIWIICIGYLMLLVAICHSTFKYIIPKIIRVLDIVVWQKKSEIKNS